MNSRWSDAEAAEHVARYADAGADLALRVYTSRLIGADPGLVLHGGGNTSVKTVVRDLFGEEIPVLCVKASGWDLARIEPAGLPAVALEPLQRLRGLDELGDEEMVDQLRGRLLLSSAPTPSVEALLHAFLPHAFVDHTHAEAILVLTNQPDGAELVRQALGERVVVLPWIMPGFPLAKAVAEAFERQPDCEGIVLDKHGIFTFADDARQSYERMIDLVDRAEQFAAHRVGGRQTATTVVAAVAREEVEQLVAAVAPVVRGAVAVKVPTPWGEQWRRAVVQWRGDDDLVAFSRHPEARALVELGPLTPDHLIRTKGRYLFLSADAARDPERCRREVAGYTAWYRGYFEAHRSSAGSAPMPPAMLSPMPAVAVVEGAGLLALGPDLKAASVAGDIAAHTLRAKAVGHAIGTFEGLSAGELFEMEYWSLQLAKLGKGSPPPLGGQVAFLTGAGGAIGLGIAEALLDAGAQVFLVDLDAERLGAVFDRLTARFPLGSLRTAAVDVTDAEAVASAFDECCREFGGVDLVVPNAGIAHVSRLESMDPQRFRRVLDVNVTGTLLVLKEAARVLRLQGTGGTVVVQASKNAFAPGAGFGAYSASKAAGLQLGKIAALEFAELGVRVNMVNADGVFGDDGVPSGLWQEVGPDRMKARGLDPEGLRAYYRDRNLLKTTVLARHVGEAVVFFASGRTPTTGATLPVDGGLPEAFPR